MQYRGIKLRLIRSKFENLSVWDHMFRSAAFALKWPVKRFFSSFAYHAQRTIVLHNRT